MSALIRQATPDTRIRDLGIHPLTAVHAQSQGDIETPSIDRAPEIVALEREVASLRRQLEESEARHRIDRESAIADAQARFARDETAALAILEAGISAANAQMRERLSTLDSLALVMCETVLQKLLGDGARAQDFLTRAIAAQMAGLRRQTVLHVNVSAIDFPNDTALQKLKATLGETRISADAALPRGECRIDVRLGHIELSLPQYWQALSEELRRMAIAAGPP